MSLKKSDFTFTRILNFIYHYKIEIFCLAIIWSAILLSLSAANQKTVTTQSKAGSNPPVGSTTLSNLEIAGKTISCLSGLKDENGLYLVSEKCSSDGICRKAGASSTGPRPIWALFKYYQKTQAANILNIIKSDLVTNTTKPVSIQNDSLNCKLMADLYESSFFSATDREMIKKICLSGAYGPQVEIEGRRLVANKDYVFNFNTVKSARDVGAKSATSIITNNDLSSAGFQVSDLVGRNKFTQNLEDIDLAKSVFKKAAGIYAGNVLDSSINSGVCMLGTAAVDLYKATSGVEYLNFATYVWDKENISPSNFYALTAKADCGLFASALFSVTRDQKYKTAKDQFVESLKNNNFDYLGFRGFSTGDGCFNLETSENFAIKNIAENSYIVGLLLTD